MYRRWFKRPLDIVMSLVILAVIWPVLFLVALAIRLDSPGPALFRQERTGLHGRPFVMLKFRSMRMNTEHEGTGAYSEKDDPRVTRVGKILRATSLDELPQLANILRGEMSFIGPRPLPTWHPKPFAEYTEEEKKMFDVRPGITGWAQIHGRRNIEWNRRVELNIWYGEHLSAKLDALILLRTLLIVFTGADNVDTDTAH